LARDPGDAVEPSFLLLDEIVAQLAGPIVELDRCAEQRATPVALLLRRPVEPCPEQAPESCGARRLAQRWQDHTRAEVLHDALEHGELEGLLRAEVREQTALRVARSLVEPADREPLEAVDARDRHGVAENRCARDLAFDHGRASYERSFFF